MAARPCTTVGSWLMPCSRWLRAGCARSRVSAPRSSGCARSAAWPRSPTRSPCPRASWPPATAAPARHPARVIATNRRLPMSSVNPPDLSPHMPNTSRSAPDPAGTPPLLGSMWASLRGFWDDAQGYQRLAYLVGVALIATGLVHAGIWAVVGGSAAGPLSWRKPMTFGMSFGLTTATLGWAAAYLPVSRRTGWAASGLLCAATTVEVAWVALQHARGVPSHFNTATTLDNSLFIMGGAAIAVTILVTAAMTLTAVTRTTAAPPMAWAIRSGLVALLAAQAVPMHAIQVFAVLAWLLSFSGLPQRRQLWLVALAVAGYAVLFGVVLLRTADGLEPFDLRSASTAGYLIAVGLLAAVAVAVVVSVGRRVAPPRS